MNVLSSRSKSTEIKLIWLKIQFWPEFEWLCWNPLFPYFQAGRFLEEGLLPIDPSSKSTDIVVPGLGVVKPCEVWEYWSIPQFDGHEDITYGFNLLKEDAATSTILVNSCQELEQAMFEAFQRPHAFPFEVNIHTNVGLVYRWECMVWKIHNYIINGP